MQGLIENNRQLIACCKLLKSLKTNVKFSHELGQIYCSAVSRVYYKVEFQYFCPTRLHEFPWNIPSEILGPENDKIEKAIFFKNVSNSSFVISV